MPTPLTKLLARFVVYTTKRIGALEAKDISVEAWRDDMERSLVRYHTAALLAGQGSTTLTKAGKAAIERTVSEQLKYLDKFAIEIQGAAEWQAGWNARAAMYAQSIKEPYWTGKTKFLPLPAMPAQGTECLSNCQCEWDIEELDGDGNYDCTWVRGANDSCQTCVQRGEEWNPVEIRDGVLL